MQNNKILVVGRCWKFVDFLIPTVNSVSSYHSDVDIMVIDNKSSRSENITTYCKQLLKSKIIKYFVALDKNYFGNLWFINKYFVDTYKDYEYLCFTDLDIKILDPQINWLYHISNILRDYQYVGAVSVDFIKSDYLPVGLDWNVAQCSPETKLPNVDLWTVLTDGWFYMVRTSDFLEFLNFNMDQIGPGMHGYNKYCQMKGLLWGRTNIFGEHLGWLRYQKEWVAAYEEAGIQFSSNDHNRNNMEFLSLQGNWNSAVAIPSETSYRLYKTEE